MGSHEKLLDCSAFISQALGKENGPRLAEPLGLLQRDTRECIAAVPSRIEPRVLCGSSCSELLPQLTR
jgi:hypothetical protein